MCLHLNRQIIFINPKKFRYSGHVVENNLLAQNLLVYLYILWNGHTCKVSSIPEKSSLGT